MFKTHEELAYEKKFKLNEELVFEHNGDLITNPYVCVGATWIECDPFEEYGKTN